MPQLQFPTRTPPLGGSSPFAPIHPNLQALLQMLEQYGQKHTQPRELGTTGRVSQPSMTERVPGILALLGAQNIPRSRLDLGLLAMPMLPRGKKYVISRIDVVKPSAGKPHGAYFSIERKGFKSPHTDIARESGARTYKYEIQPRNPLLVESQRSFDSAGISALDKLLPAEEVRRIKGLGEIGESSFDLRGSSSGRDVLIARFKKEYPKAKWENYYDPRELLEGYAGLKARERGFDTIIQMDRRNPDFSELIVLDPALLK